jgi:hypothetical protein
MIYFFSKFMGPEHVEIVVVPSSFDRARSGAITGPVWLRHGRRDVPPTDFPEANWTDFPIVILGWWLEALRSPRGAEVECSFMDGPFEFTVSGPMDTLARVCCFGRGIEAKVPVVEFFVPVRMLITSLLSAAASALAECDRRGWAGSDVEQLRALLRSAAERDAGGGAGPVGRQTPT